MPEIHSLAQIHNAMLARLSDLSSTTIDLADAIRECCQDLPLGRSLQVSGHEITPRKAQCLLVCGASCSGSPEWHICRVLTIDHHLVPEPRVEKEGSFEDGMTTRGGLFEQVKGDWFVSGPYQRYESQHKHYLHLLHSGSCDPDYLEEPCNPAPMPPCNLDILQQVATSLPQAMAAWHVEQHERLALQTKRNRQLTATLQ